MNYWITYRLTYSATVLLVVATSLFILTGTVFGITVSIFTGHSFIGVSALDALALVLLFLSVRPIKRLFSSNEIVKRDQLSMMIILLSGSSIFIAVSALLIFVYLIFAVLPECQLQPRCEPKALVIPLLVTLLMSAISMIAVEIAVYRNQVKGKNGGPL